MFTCCVLFQNNIQAAQSDEVSFDEYYVAMKKEYKKYGIDYEIEDVSSAKNITITKKKSQECLKLPKKQFGDLKITPVESLNDQSNEIGIRGVAPYTVDKYKDFNITCNIGAATIRVRLIGTANAIY